MEERGGGREERGRRERRKKEKEIEEEEEERNKREKQEEEEGERTKKEEEEKRERGSGGGRRTGVGGEEEEQKEKRERGGRGGRRGGRRGGGGSVLLFIVSSSARSLKELRVTSCSLIYASSIGRLSGQSRLLLEPSDAPNVDPMDMTAGGIFQTYRRRQSEAGPRCQRSCITDPHLYDITSQITGVAMGMKTLLAPQSYMQTTEDSFQFHHRCRVMTSGRPPADLQPLSTQWKLNPTLSAPPRERGSESWM
ncbi:unnamed protein product [Pleuronectes platessa]|uniref:Uncharacterized protein n=1 Tax=Pleuronectes platessa TaxID=8262 RepID=A0A9N7U043_PLEPL|nr:unnamed protein product [Pleuronectes platessa]